MGTEMTVGSARERIVDDAAGVAGEGREQRVGLTDEEAAKGDIALVQIPAVVWCRCRLESRLIVVGPSRVVEAEFGVGAQRAILGLGTSVDAKRETGALVVGVVDVNRCHR